MKKNAQAALFIIVGVIILLFLTFVFYSSRESSEELTQSFDQNFRDIEIFLDKCLQDKEYEGVYLFGLGGGVLYPEDYYLVYNQTSLGYSILMPYFIYNGKDLTPAFEDYKLELSKYVSYSLSECFSNLSSLFPEYEITKSQIKDIEIELSANSIFSDIFIDLVIKKGDLIYKKDKISVEIPARLGVIYDAIKNITTTHLDNDNRLCTSCLLSLMKEKDIYIETREASNENSYVIVFSIIDNKTLITNYPFIFNFATKFNISSDQSILKLKDIPDQTIQIGYRYEYQVEAIGNNIEYFDSTDLFEIDPKIGLIEFTPTKDQLGSYIITITAEDNKGNKDSKNFKLSINQFGVSPKITPISYQTAFVGQEFIYNVIVTDPDSSTIYYSDNSDLFDISNEGVVKFIPTTEQKGDYAILITAIDEIGNKDTEDLNLFIT